MKAKIINNGETYTTYLEIGKIFEKEIGNGIRYKNGVLPKNGSVLKVLGKHKYENAINMVYALQLNSKEFVLVSESGLEFINEVTKSNALLIYVMDVSGSMGNKKKTIGKMIKKQTELVLMSKYWKVDTRYVIHTTVANEVDEEEAFSYGNSGGTYISSGLNKVLDIIDEVNVKDTDIYVVHVSDGDNWGEDNDNTVEAVNKLSELVSSYSYYEVKSSKYRSTIMTRLEEDCKNKNIIKLTKINSKVEALSLFEKIRDDFRYGQEILSESKKIDSKLMSSVPDVVKIKRYDNITEVIISGEYVGIAVKNDKDEYDNELSFYIAYERAKIEKQKAYVKHIIKNGV